MDYRPEPWALAALAATLVAAAVSDIRSGKIRNVVTYPAIALGLIVQTYLYGRTGLAQAAGGFATGFVPLLICWAIGGIGGGDAKLMGAVGALSNWRFTVAAMLMAFAIAAAMAIVVMIRKRIVRRTLVRIGRTLWLALIPGVKRTWPADVDSPKIPFGVALCIGSAAAWIDSLFDGPIARTLLGG